MTEPSSPGAGSEPPAEAGAPQVGVGPWEGAWPEGEHWDPELLRLGDRRNVADEFRYWRLEAIVAALDERRHDFHVAIENWGHDFNIGSVVRTANAFLAREVHIIGRRRWNRRGAMVTERYQHLRHHPTSEEFLSWARQEGLPVIAVDNVPGSEPLELFDLPQRCVLLFGQEGPGVSPEVLEAATATVAIEQFGSTRSINAGAAAAVTMHAWIRRHVHGQIPAGES
ncbi:RNA methyltransferase [Kocuria sp. p3-SID1433]|uniref:TrmH family RNA methyltransferase n=1 Tax=unclassified Kocuria TaxID=2649579 RepID=UPI0021A65177|nr:MULTISPECIES: RNA methyltransferase [unclassified Kocuria]MCT1600946.1 RNA methyltransferase [Kocuria sp. p3-SID1428]MCT2179050.1 RNA methyltransferase [Kocuria sp. p3-SID1433]